MDAYRPPMRRRQWFLGACAAGVLGLLFSCPAPIQQDMLLHSQDRLGPTITVSTPENDSYYTSTVVFTGTATDDAFTGGDAAGSVDAVSYEVADSSHSGDVALEEGQFTFSFSTLHLVGDQEVVLTAEDWNGNSTEVTVTLVDDTLGPAIAITSPEDQSVYQRLVCVEGAVSSTTETAGDASEVVSVSYEVLTTTIGDDLAFGEDGAFSFQFHTDGLSDDLVVKIAATDVHGDTSERSFTLKNDEMGPFVTMNSPEQNSYYAATVIVEGTASNSEADPGTGEIKSLIYEVLNSSIGDELSSDGGAFFFQFETEGLEGSLLVRVTAEDWNENSTKCDLVLTDGGSGIPTLTTKPDCGEVTLEWEDVPLSDHYTVYYETADILPTEEFSTRIEEATSPCTLTGLANGHMHIFQLRSHSSSGGDNWSEAVKAIPLSSLMLAPMLTPEYDSILVQWQDIPGTDEYQVYKSTSPSDPGLNISGTIAGTTFADTAVERGPIYYYAVKPAHHCDILSEGVAAVTRFFRTQSERNVGGESTPGFAEGVAVSGSYAYLADNHGFLLVIDVSVPEAPQEIGRVSTSGNPRGVAISGTCAYVADGVGGLTIIDVSAPSGPNVVGSVSTLGPAWGVAVCGSYAYVAAYDHGLRVIHVGTPSAPHEVGGVLTPGSAYDVAVSYPYAYVADANGGLRVINISSPSSPQEIGDVATPGSAGSVAVSGSCVYVADGTDGGLRIIDVSTPSAPEEIGNVATPGWARGVAVSGSYAYVADGGAHGLRIIDVSASSSPREVGEAPTLGMAAGVAASGFFAFVADWEGGLQVVDVRTPSAPQEVGAESTPGFAEGVAVSGSYAFVADYQDGLRVIDVSEPSTPSEIGEVDTPGLAFDVAVSGSQAFVADWDHGLRIVDVSTVSAPQEISHVAMPGNARGVCVCGVYVYVAAGSGGLRIVDVSTPAVPEEVGHAATPGDARGVAVSGSYAYVADGYPYGLRIIDVSNPSAPQEVGDVFTPGDSYGVTVAGSYAYVADSFGGLRVIDVSTPSDPQPVGDVPTTAACQVVVSGAYAYIADGGGGLRVIDVSTPSAPKEIGHVDTLVGAAGVAVVGSYAYVADGSGGLRVIDLWPFD